MLHGTVPSQCDLQQRSPIASAMRFAHPQSPGVSSLDMLLGPRWPAEGHMNKVDSSSLASFTSPLYRLTTPAAREEQGTSLYLRYNIPPHAPRAGSAKEATSGVFAGPAWPDFASPAVASLGPEPRLDSSTAILDSSRQFLDSSTASTAAVKLSSRQLLDSFSTARQRRNARELSRLSSCQLDSSTARQLDSSTAEAGASMHELVAPLDMVCFI